MADLDISDDELRGKLQTEIEKGHPDLIAEFNEDIELLVENAKKKIATVLGMGRQQDTQKMIQATAREWIREKMINFAYFRYYELMEKQGYRPLSEKMFNKIPEEKGELTFAASKRFMTLEENGISIGDQVINIYRTKSIVYTVKSITRQVLLILIDERDNKMLPPNEHVHWFRKL